MAAADRQIADLGQARRAGRPHDLLALARSRSLEDRKRLLIGVVAMCETTPPTRADSALLGDVFLLLISQAENDIRRNLAERLASSDWAPAALINALALDEIEIARPIIAGSPLLGDQDLLRILVEATIEHQIAVARRPGISGRVTDAIIDAAEPAVMTALATNRSAEIGEAGVRRLVEHSRRVAALRAPLVRHPRMTTRLAEQLYGWVGDALRQAIGERFRVDGDALERSLSAAVQSASEGALEPRNARADVDALARTEMERRLVAKLDRSGQLSPGYLVRALREGRLGLFEAGLAMLGGFTAAQVRRAIRASDCSALAAACTAVGIDRAIFPGLVEDLRTLNNGLPGGGPVRASALFNLAPDAAARTFRETVADSPVGIV